MRNMPQWCLVGPQLLELMLREIAESQVLRGISGAAAKVDATGDRLQQRRFTRTVRAEQADAIARQHAPVDVAQHGRAIVSRGCMLEAHELSRSRGRGREGKAERAVDMRGGNALHTLQGPDAAL